MRMKRKVQAIPAFLLASVMLLMSVPVYADEIENLESKTSDLQNLLNDINQDLLAISDEIASTETKIQDANNEMFRIQDSLAISRENEIRQYDDMKTRIKYMYENGNNNLLDLLFSAENMSDFLNRAEFIHNISSYDREKLENLRSIQKGIEQQEADLTEKQNSLNSLQTQLKSQQDALNQKAAETSTDLAVFNQKLQALRAEQARAAEEARRVAEAQKAAEAKKAAEAQKPVSTVPSGDRPQTDSTAPDADGTQEDEKADTDIPTQETTYIPSESGGALTPSKGVVYYNGHRETYYSQKVLPGGGLNIPGRHVASDGTIRDADGYICVASSDLPWGSIVETSLGTGKVYDCGCASGTIDIYTDW